MRKEVVGEEKNPKNQAVFFGLFERENVNFYEKYEKNELYIMKKKGARAPERARAFPLHLLYFFWS